MEVANWIQKLKNILMRMKGDDEIGHKIMLGRSTDDDDDDDYGDEIMKKRRRAGGGQDVPVRR